jgi:hypothetical protein
MPPSAVWTIRDLIHWQYAKIISESAGFGRKKYGFVMSRFKRLQDGEIEWSSSIRKFVRDREKPGECIYCGSTAELSRDHLVPRERGGPDAPDNVVEACRKCRSAKGDKGIYEWFQLSRRYDVPGPAEGKYLKVLQEMHSERGTLDVDRATIERLCEQCEIGYLCPEKAALTVYCLESVLSKAH